jgi:hypothetical protein
LLPTAAGLTLVLGLLLLGLLLGTILFLTPPLF